MAFADGYVEVKDRIAAFIAEYPQGSLQSEITHLSDTLVVVKAWAYRTPDDQRPGMGHSSLGIPGKTNFTRDAEIENAETSAWGRAIAALGFEVKKSIATSNEIANKQPTAEPTPEPKQCPVHNTPMAFVPRKKAWAHKAPDGSVCEGKAA